jgi:hypothetical protein
VSWIARATAMLLVSAVVAGCTPSGIPKYAKMESSLKDGQVWYWNRTLKTGCAAWMAKESWAHVRLVAGKTCEERLNGGYETDRGASYVSFEDHLTFVGYWPWTSEIYHDRMVFEDGMIVDVLPCPHVLPQAYIDQLRLVAEQAAAASTTDAERRVAARIGHRLSEADGAALQSQQSGCADLPRNWSSLSAKGERDPWAVP